MNTLFETRKNSDLHFEASNGRCQKVHKCIISNEIPSVDEILSDKLYVEGIEVDSSEIPRLVFPHCSYDILQLLLEYVYLGTVELEKYSDYISLLEVASKLKYDKFIDYLSDSINMKGFDKKDVLKEFIGSLMKIKELPELKMNRLVYDIFANIEKEISENMVFKDLKDLSDPNRHLLNKNGYNFNCGQNGHSSIAQNTGTTLCTIYTLLLTYDNPNLLKMKGTDLFIYRDVEGPNFYNSQNNGNVAPFYSTCGCLNGLKNHKMYKFKDVIKLYPFFKYIDYKKTFTVMCKIGECNVYYLYEVEDIRNMITQEDKLLKFKEKYYYKN